MDCDVATAFDPVSHHADCRLGQRVQELRDDREARRYWDPQGLRRTRSVPQGDPCVADLPRCSVKCAETKMGLLVGNGYLGLLLFADNCWIIEMSPGDLQTMARAWNELRTASGLQIDWGEAVWCSTAQDNLAASITVSETVITRRTREEGFKALGVWITFDGSLHERIG